MASIDAAVQMIGMQALNRLVVACGVSASLEVPGVDLTTFWRDALIAWPDALIACRFDALVVRAEP